MSSLADDVLSASFTDDLDQVQVSLCFDGKAPSKLYRNQRADAFSNGILYQGQQLYTPAGEYSLRLPALPDNACVNWQIDLKKALEENDYRLILKTGEDLLMSADLWFWKGPMDRNLIVEIQLPEGVAISVPWQELENTGNTIRFRPDKTSSDWESKIAIGTFQPENIRMPGAYVRLAAIGKLSAGQRSMVKGWIEESASSVTAAHGHLPQPGPQVLVVATGPANEAVVHGQVLRGGGLAAVLYIDETRPLSEFSSDWTATHEFSHMLLPYVSTRDRWLSEGLASYYQNVLRARDGRLDETQAWQNLYEGFKRGEKNTHGGSLAKTTRNGWGSTMRVYWSGAAILLMADIQLRRQSGDAQSLDTALKDLAGCCMANGITWRARDIFVQLDKLTGTEVFMNQYHKYVHADGFPDVDSVWKSLGIDVRSRRVILLNDGSLTEIRDAIMKP